MAKRKRDGYGRMCGMTGRGEIRPPAVWFAYTPDRKGEHPKAHLREFTGKLQADGYAGYDVVYEGG
jgi:transposase